VQQAREASRRSQCAGNLKQLALAAAQYETSHEMLPSGGFGAKVFAEDPKLFLSSSCFVALAPYVEQQAAFAAYNFNVALMHPANHTVAGVGMSVLWCPSDPSIAQPQPLDPYYLLVPGREFTQAFTSYAANAGTWEIFTNPNEPDAWRAWLGVMNGVIY